MAWNTYHANTTAATYPFLVWRFCLQLTAAVARELGHHVQWVNIQSHDSWTARITDHPEVIDAKMLGTDAAPGL